MFHAAPHEYLTDTPKCLDNIPHSMDLWGWLAVYVVGLTLLQFLLYRFVRDGDGGVRNDYLDDGTAEGDSGGRRGIGPGQRGRSGTTPSDSRRDKRGRHERPRDDRADPPAGPRFESRRPQAVETTDGGRICPHCGTENHDPDGTYRYCEHCVQPM
jgi:hypothetical protein